MELPLARLLLVLSHHPDYIDINLGELKRLTKWVVSLHQINADRRIKLMSNFRHIEFFLDSVANRDNVSLLYHIASKIKTVRDTYPTMTPDADDEGEEDEIPAVRDLCSMATRKETVGCGLTQQRTSSLMRRSVWKRPRCGGRRNDPQARCVLVDRWELLGRRGPR